MTQRLFEREPRAASITSSGSVPCASGRTQASNFSLRTRSAAWDVTGTGSIPNCRKQSASKTCVGSLKPTNAARAAALRVVGEGAKVVVKALSMIGEDSTFENHCALLGRTAKVPKGQRTA